MDTEVRPLWRRQLPLIVIGLLLLLLIAAVGRQLEMVEEEVDDGPTAEARRNPFLASQRLLERHHIPHRAERGFAGLETMQWQDERIDRDDTLILINTFHNLHERQVDRLWDWVDNGGRLIISVENPFIGSGEHLRDPLLSRLQMTLHPSYDMPPLNDFDEDASECTPPDDEMEPAPAVDQDVPASMEDHPQLEEQPNEEPFKQSCWLQTEVYAQLDSDDPDLTIGVSGNSYLRVHDQTVDILAGDENAAFLTRHQQGDGEIYVITSATAWQNAYIGCADNAYLFWWLTRESAKVWYAVNLQTPSFWRYLWQLSAAACVALILALAFWLWTQATRFGPILQPQKCDRRPFIDHIRATSQFTLRHQGNQALAELLREDISHCANRRYPGFTDLKRNDQIRTLHTMSGIATNDIDIALFHPMPLSESQFLDVVKRLQQLRNRL